MGMADRGHAVPVTPTTRFGVASGSKSCTALTVVSLIVDGVLSLETRARSLLGSDLPLIDDGVTVEHLLAQRSGIGDYLDEEQMGPITDHAMPVAVHLLAETEQFVEVLDGHPQVSPPGERWAYNNGGFVVLALLAERAAGMPFHDLVQQRVFDPAGMRGAAYLRNDELPGDVAIGYLFADGLRTNALHLPVRGTGDGGAQLGIADVDAFWRALFAGRIVPQPWVDEMVRPRSTTRVRAPPVRTRLLAGRRARRAGGDGGLRRRCVVPLGPRPGDGADAHGRVQLERWRLAAVQAARRPGVVTPVRPLGRSPSGTLGACRRSVT